MIQIFGGAGFVGTKICDVLDAKGLEYQILDKKCVGPGYIDIADPKTFTNLNAASAVINLAAEHRDDVTPEDLYFKVNVEGAANVCDHCRRQNIKTIVFTSSVAVYGFAGPCVGESEALAPFNAYGRSKAEAESVYEAWYEEDPTERSLVIVRPTVIFGEGNRGNVYNLMNQIAQGKFIMVGSGKNVKSMAYVANVASFLIHTLKAEPGIHVFNYADGPDMNMNEFVSIVRRQILGKNGVGLRVPYWTGVLGGVCLDLAAKLTRRRYPISYIRVKKFASTTSFSSERANRIFEATVPLADALARTIAFEFPDWPVN